MFIASDFIYLYPLHPIKEGLEYNPALLTSEMLNNDALTAADVAKLLRMKQSNRSEICLPIRAFAQSISG